ncbi:MAG: hypothetical protein ACREQE_01150, partial [Candidatus Binataceae bacterium]
IYHSIASKRAKITAPSDSIKAEGISICFPPGWLWSKWPNGRDLRGGYRFALACPLLQPSKFSSDELRDGGSIRLAQKKIDYARAKK